MRRVSLPSSCAQLARAVRASPRRHWRTPAALLAIALAALGSGATALGAPKTTLERTEGDVSATVSFRGSVLFATAVRLRIERDGKALVTGRLQRSPRKRAADAIPTGLHVRDLDVDGEPEVVMDLHTGGLHCCTVSRIYTYDGDRGVYELAEHRWGNDTYVIRDLDGDGVLELVGTDDRFAYAFTAFSSARAPVRVWRLDGSKLVDVTAEHRGAVRTDTRALWSAYRQERRKPRALRGDVRGILAAWQANKLRLGQGAEGWQVLKAARKRGELRGSGPWPAGRRYLAHVREFLTDVGYR